MSRPGWDHPVVDADGHILELVAAALPYLRDALGPADFDRYRRAGSELASRLGSAGDLRATTRAPQGGWWSSPLRDTRDLAASLAPRLMHERLGEIGIDYAVLYPTHALASAAAGDEALRRGLCRGWNDYFAETYGRFDDRMTVAGMIPMDTPEEALAELEHCKAIGLKVVGIPHMVLRPLPAPARSPWQLQGQRQWCDYFGLESAFDYDPVWAKFVELGYAITVHVGIGAAPVSWYHWVDNFVANHIGSFAWACHPACKALVLGGVTRRFPGAAIAFQECGVSWALALLCDLIEHWEKRNRGTLDEIFDPRLLDLDGLREMVQAYAPELVAGVDDLDAALVATMLWGRPPPVLDEFEAMAVDGPGDIVGLFAPRLWFGCEPDDRTVAQAFAPGNGLDVDLNVMLGSDISHFDTPSMAEVLPDVGRLVERGVLSPEQRRAFVCDNAVRLFTTANPDFFKGTAVETYATSALGKTAQPGR